jgi:hypothetical protein
MKSLMADPSTQELGAGDDREFRGVGTAVADDVRHPITRPHRHGGLVHDDQRVIHDIGHCFGRHAHVAQVCLSIDIGGGPYGDEDELSIFEGVVILGGENEPTAFDIAFDQLLQAGS